MSHSCVTVLKFLLPSLFGVIHKIIVSLHDMLDTYSTLQLKLYVRNLRPLWQDTLSSGLYSAVELIFYSNETYRLVLTNVGMCFFI